MASAETFFVRRARKLMRRPETRSRFHVTHLEDRLAPAVAGTVFQDFNANGAFDTAQVVANDGGQGGTGKLVAGTYTAAQDVGVGGVTVTVFDAAGAKVDQVTSAADGTWKSTLTAAGKAYRVEFTGVPLNGFYFGPHGAGSGTSVQFVTDPAATVNLSLVRATEYYRANPILATSRYAFGDQSIATPAIIGFPYSAGSVVQTTTAGANEPAPSDYALSVPATQVGATWGLGYNRVQKVLYASAFTKRHVGWREEQGSGASLTGGPGQIYLANIPTAATLSGGGSPVTTAAPWVNLEAVGTVLDGNTANPYAVDVVGAFGAYATAREGYTNDTTNTSTNSFDTDGGNTGWNAVGKTSFGGLDVSADGTRVFVMSLADRRLYVIPVNANGTANTAGIRAYAVPIPSNATAADVRPWAVQVNPANGLVYVGMVDSAETSGNRANLRGYVYTFDPATGTFSASSVVNDGLSAEGFQLDYAKGSSFAGLDNFEAWSPTYQRRQPLNVNGGIAASQYPQPMLTGLAFDSAGNLTLSIRDRNGDQTGRGTRSDPTDDGTGADPTPIRVEGVSSGDILKAFVAPGGGWRLEAAGANPNPPGQVGTQPGSGQGPAGGEFYGEDDFGAGGHLGTSLGGVAQVPGFPDVVNTHFDPIRNSGGAGVRTGGVRWFDASNGTLVKSYQIYKVDEGYDPAAPAVPTADPNGTFGKANGLGDLVALEAFDPPVEIGNRVFRDLDRDGVQDADEPGIAGVTVQLYDTTGTTKLAEVTTEADGSYYFNSGPAPGAINKNEAYDVPTLKAGGTYQVRVPNAAGFGTQQTPLVGLVLTKAGVSTPAFVGDTNFNARNSDGTLGAGALATAALVTANLSTSKVGESNHTFDVGFATGLTLGDTVFEDLNNDGLLNGADAGVDGVAVSLFTDADGNNVPDQVTPIATATTAGGGQYLFPGLLPGKYIVQIVTPGGYRSSSGGGVNPDGAFESGLVGNSNTNNEDHGKTVSGDSLNGYVVRTNTVTLFDLNDPTQNPDKAANSAQFDANLRQDFGIYRVYGLGNRVWLDKNNSGTIDAADGGTPGIDGVTVRLYRPTDFDAGGNLAGGATALRTTTTAGGGYYRFDDLLGSIAGNAAQGQYVAVVDGTSAPLGGRRSSTGGTSATTTFEPAPNAIPAVDKTDSDDNGTTIAGSLVRSGTVTLGPGANAPTAEADLVAGVNPQGTVDAQADMTLDFGFVQPLSLGNQLFNDENNNGKLEAGEAGINGASVSIFRADGAGNPVGAALETQTTKNGGYYLFTGLGADSYVVQVDKTTLPAGFWRSSSGTNGSTSGPFEPGADPNTDRRDEIDRGTETGNLLRATAVALSAGTAPTGEPVTPGVTDPTPDADSNLTLDFGVYQPLSLGNLVWNDKNNSGTVDAADGATPGIDGVSVRLYQDNGDGVFDPATDVLVGTQQTKSGGFYLFQNLAATSYFVEIAPPAGFASSTGTPGSPTGPYEPGITADLDNEDHGTNKGVVIRSGLVTLTVGGEPAPGVTTPGFTDPVPDGNKNYTVDFGIYQSLSLGDFVWNDANNNGVLDAATEKGIPNVTVTLLDAGGNALTTTTTDANGNYIFRDLSAGKYSVQVTPPAGFVSSTGKPGSPIGPNEPGLNDNTDNADHGSQVGNVVISGPVTLGPAGDPLNPDAGVANLRQDFGLFVPLSLGNFVWEDANNNGRFDTGESPLQNVGVALLDGGGATIATTATDANGNYLFTNLVAGDYTVRVTAPAGYVTSTGKNGSPTGPYEPGVTGTQDNEDHGTATAGGIDSTVTLAAPGDPANPDNNGVANLRQDFGLFRPLTLGDFVWNDLNNSGKLDAGEAGFANVPVELLDAAGATVGTTTTDANGKYTFTGLIPGDYTVRITPPAGFRSSVGAPNSLTGPYEPGVTGTQDNEDHGTQNGNVVDSKVTLAAPGSAANPDNAGLANLRQDFGLFQSLTLGNFVWEDANNNGKLDAGEKGLAGVTVTLFTGAGTQVATTTTDANGNYLFGGLSAGTYQVRVTPPTGYATSTGTVGSPTGPYEPGVNGTQDNEDHGTSAGAVVQTVVVTLGAAGSATNPDNAGTSNLRQDFGLFRPLSVGNLIWDDLNNNGKRDAGEPGLSGVSVTLLTPGGAVVATTTTDADGGYLFGNLIPGDYTVRLSNPAGYNSSTGTPGSPTGPYEPGVRGPQDNEDHGTQSGATTSSTVTLTAPGSAGNPDNAGLANLRQDFGLFRPLSVGNLVWLDANNNGKLDGTEAGIGGVSVALLDATGATVGTTTTAASGNYLFTNLSAGTFTVRVTPPAKLVSSTGQNGSPTGPYEPGVTGTQDNEDHGTRAGTFVTSSVTLSAPGSGNPDNGGLANLRQDFGLFEPLSIGTIVFTDANNNGKLDSGTDAGVPSVTVRLVDGTGAVIATTTTGTDGKYLFSDLIPGSYAVQIVPPAGVRPSDPVFGPLEGTTLNVGTAGTAGVVNSPAITLALGQGPQVGGNTDVNFYPTLNFGLLALAKVSGFTYLDNNTSGKYDPSGPDRPIPFTTVTLTGTDTLGNPVTRTTTSDKTGFYEFADLPAGKYTLTETQPAGSFFQGTDNVGSLGGTNPNINVLTVTLNANDSGLQYNFGEVLPSNLFGYVWVDTDRDCTRDANEPGLSGVPITISGTAYAGTPRARPLTAADLPTGSLTTTTGPDGRYQFPVLPPGSYTVSRGDLPPASAAIYTDWCLQNGDPSGTPPGFGDNQFTTVVTTPPTRGPLNFGVVPNPTDPTKRNLLGSSDPTAGGGGAVGEIPAPGGPTRGPVNYDPTFAVTTGNPAAPVYSVVAGGAGFAPLVRVFDFASGLERFRLVPYEDTFTGGVRVATGDVDGDGVPDIVTATGVGGGPRIRVFNGLTGAQIREFFAFEPTFRGGVFVSVGDVNGDGRGDVIVGAEIGGGPRVTIFDGGNGTQLANFFAFDASQRGGVRVAAADLNGDGRADLIATTGTGVPTRVRTFDSAQLGSAAPAPSADFAPYEPAFTGGVNIAAADYNGDGTPDIVVGAEAGGGPRVQVFDGKTRATLADFFAFESTATGGVRVSAKDVSGDNKAELIVTPGPGGSSRVRVLRATDLAEIDAFTAFDPDFVGGAYVG